MSDILILGASGTIGTALVEALGNENLFLAGRSFSDTAKTFNVDLNDFKSVKLFCKKLKLIKIDILIINSGIFSSYSLNEDLIDTNLMVNSLAPFYIARWLLKINTRLEIIVTSSISISRAQLDFKPKKWFKIYRNTKLLEYLLFENLAIEYPDSSIKYVHPGITKSALSLSLHKPFVCFLIRHFAMKPKSAIKVFLYARQIPNRKGYWVCPNLNLFGRPKLKKIKVKIRLDKEEYHNIINKLTDLEEHYTSLES